MSNQEITFKVVTEKHRQPVAGSLFMSPESQHEMDWEGFISSNTTDIRLRTLEH